MSPLNEVTQDASSAVSQTDEDKLPSSDAEPRTSDSETHDFAKFPDATVEDDQHVDQPVNTEVQMSNDKFSDSFLASRDTADLDDVNQVDSAVVASSSFELMSPSSDKDSVSLPSPEAPPPPLPENVLTAEMASEPPLPPPRPKVHVNDQVGPTAEHDDVSVTAVSSARTEVVHSSPVQGSPATVPVCDAASLTAKSSLAATVTAVVSTNPSQPVTSSTVPHSRFTVHPSSGATGVNDALQFSLVFPSDDATPPPLPPRNIPVSSDMPKQQLMRGISLPASGKIHSVDDVPPPPPPRRSLTKSITSSRPVDPFAPIPVSVPVSLVPVRQHDTVVATMPSSCPVVETTIAPLPRPRPHLRQTDTVVSEAASSTVLPTSSGSSSPWHSISTPPITEPIPVDPFSNVDPFAGSVSPDDPFAAPSLDGMLSDLCHDFDTDTLSLSAFRTRAVTIDSVSSDVYDTSSVASTSGHYRDASSVLDESRCTVSPAPPAQSPNMEAGSTGCLVDINTADDVNTAAKWQPFSQGMSGLDLFGDLQDVWYSSASVVNWKTASQPSDVTSDISESSVVSNAAGSRQDDVLMQLSDTQPSLDTAASARAVCQPDAGSADMSGGSLVVTDVETNHCSIASGSSHHNATTDGAAADTVHAATDPLTELSQVTSSTERFDYLSDAVLSTFDDCFISTPAAAYVAASRTTDVSVSNLTCAGKMSTTSTACLTNADKQQNINTTHLLDSDVQVDLLIACLINVI